MNNEEQQQQDKLVKATISAKIDKSLDANINADVNNLQAKINAEIASSKGVPEELFDHLVDYNNPHKVTPEQINAYTKEETKVEIDKRFFRSPYALPTIGQPNVLYFVTNDSEESTYIWDENINSFRCVGSNYQNIEVINGGEEWQIQ